MSNLPRQQLTVQSIMQILTLAGLATGGYVGKGAYENLRDQMTDQRVTTAETRKVVESISAALNTGREERIAIQAKISGLESRLAKTEAQVEHLRSGRRR